MELLKLPTSGYRMGGKVELPLCKVRLSLNKGKLKRQKVEFLPKS